MNDVDKCSSVLDAYRSSNPTVICMQKTKLSYPELAKIRSFLMPKLHTHDTIPANGSRGGILIAWDSNTLTMLQSDHRTFSLTLIFTSTTSDHSLKLTNVYAPANHVVTNLFLTKLRDLAPTITGPWLLLGDFNLIHQSMDQNNHRFDQRLASAFNDTISDLALDELPLLDRPYTWSNLRVEPTLARLDRVFLNSQMSSSFPNMALTSHSGHI